MDDMFPCKQIPLTEKGKDEYDRIFGHVDPLDVKQVEENDVKFSEKTRQEERI